MTNETNNTAATFSFQLSNGEVIKLRMPKSLADSMSITGNKKLAADNFEGIMKKFPVWLKSREEWIKKYQSISKSLENDSNRDYVLNLMKEHDAPKSWIYNKLGQNNSVECAYSFRIRPAKGYFTHPALIITGYSFIESHKLFTISIDLDIVE